MPKIKLNEDEHKLIIRYREQARAFNEGIAACINHAKESSLFGSEVNIQIFCDELAALKKDTP